MTYLWLLNVLSLIVIASSGKSAFDISDEFQLNEPTRYTLLGKKRCYNTAAFGLLGSLEIAYTRATGIRRKFSEQEIVDCYWKGCNTTKLFDLVNWLRAVDRLAPFDKYTPLIAKPEVCRAAGAPDGLDQIQINGVVRVTVDNFEEQMQKYGSVIACYDTLHKSCPNLAKYRGGVMTGYVSKTCRQYVVIVGYTQDYYRVREAKGPAWGEDGYFKIQRGSNDCGIEHDMVALVTETRSEKKPLATNGCPLEFPKYCPGGRTCASQEQDCVKTTKEEATRRKREAGPECVDNERYNCANLVKYCKHSKVKSVCGGTCKVCEEEVSACVDKSDQCPRYKLYCTQSQAVQIQCAKTCELRDEECGSIIDQINKKISAPEPTFGQCYPPAVPNGRVLNKGALLQFDELLTVECDEGYVLGGQANKCLIQNLYAPDSRMLQVCVKNSGEEFTDQGFDYTGVQTRTVDGRVCDNWYKVTYRGYNHFPHDEIERVQALTVTAGNHNFCRNYDYDEPVPYCYVDGRLKYCFKHPGCGGEICSGAVDEDAECEEIPYERCDYKDEYKNNLPDYTWKYCAATCCEAAGCA